jgi:hypothetical protein
MDYGKVVNRIFGSEVEGRRRRGRSRLRWKTIKRLYG